ELISSNATSDLQTREADIALRSYRPTQGDLIAKKICNFKFALFANPQYLDSIGGVKNLNDAQFVGIGNIQEIIDSFKPLGLELSKDNFRLTTSSHIVYWELVKKGAGIGIGDINMGAADPDLQRIMPNMPPFEFGLWLVTHRELKTSPRIRRVFDFLSVELKKDKYAGQAIFQARATPPNT
ncbi:MAG: LysR substrate-binding domain-containing protein, partial [Alphaproteobacteria bacterium]|nr:LysR substrate-binding domain-containing protein [Alphaproteobacteria bacterium]